MSLVAWAIALVLIAILFAITFYCKKRIIICIAGAFFILISTYWSYGWGRTTEKIFSDKDKMQFQNYSSLLVKLDQLNRTKELSECIQYFNKEWVPSHSKDNIGTVVNFLGSKYGSLLQK